MSDDDESCVCCMSCPPAVRNLPCGHAFYCELCTIRAVQANRLKCGVCRCATLKLVVVPMNPAGDPPMQTYQTEPEPEGSTFESVDAFLQAKLESDDAEVAGAAQAALALEEEEEDEEEDEDEDEGPPPEDPLFPIDAQGHATVPEGETELPENAFMNCSSLISITLPASLTSIGDRKPLCIVLGLLAIVTIAAGVLVPLHILQITPFDKDDTASPPPPHWPARAQAPSRWSSSLRAP